MNGSNSQDQTPDGPSASIEPARASAPRRGRFRLSRWLRRLAICVLMLCVLVALGLWTITRSWFIVWQLQPILERKLGGSVQIEKAVYHGGGRVTFENILLTADGLRGPAAELARIERAEIEVDLSSLLAGAMRVNTAQLSGMMVRISEDISQTGRMNFMALHPAAGGASRTPPPSKVKIADLTVEVGTHVADQFVLKGQRRMAGQMLPMPGVDHVFEYELSEVDERGHGLGEEGLLVKGEWHTESTAGTGRIEGLALDDRIYRMLPRQAQLWWNRMDLTGRVDGVAIEWGPDLPLAVSFSVKDIAMTMPVDVSEVWSVYRNGAIEPTTRRPRMNVHSGSIRVGTDSLTLEELRGELVSAAGPTTASAPGDSAKSAPEMVGVPYEISLNVPRLPQIDWNVPELWMEQTLGTTAFELTARMDDFSLARSELGEAQAVGLPTIVAKVLAKFQTTNWELTTSVRVSRGDPTIDEHGMPHAAPLEVRGKAYINNARGSYQKFPYVMEDVDAFLQFTDKRVDVEYLQARGAGGSTFRVTGYIEPPDKDASFHLELTGLNVPLDDRFRAALRPNELKVVDALFNLPSVERMARGGVLPDEKMIEAQTAERDAAAARLTQLRRAPDAPASEVAMLEKRIAALERSIRAGPFVAGGVVDLRLTLDRAFGVSMPTDVRGVVDVKNAGLIFDRFPYPLRGGGRLKWEPDRVTIESTSDGPGIRFVTPAGGVGAVSGTVSFPRSAEGGRKVIPDLTFAIEDDPVNDTVFAAIPFGKSELNSTPQLASDWPGAVMSRAGRMVKGIGLGGAYDYQGRIFTRDDGKFDWDFRVSLDGGTAAPNKLLSNAFSERGQPWPDGLALSNLHGEVRIQRSGVSWNDITGAGLEAQVSTSGLIDMTGGGSPSSVAVNITNAPIDRAALNMVSAANASRAEELWSRFEPAGRMDAQVRWRSDAAPGEGGVLTLTPCEVTLRLGNEPATLNCRGGQMRITGRSVEFHELLLGLSSPKTPEGGTLSVNGSWHFAGGDPAFNVEGGWTGGRFESPLIAEALRTVGQEQQAARYQAFEPAGALDMTFRIGREADGAALTYDIEMQPRSVDFTLRDTRLHMEIAAGNVHITPGHIALQQLQGSAASGAFTVDGGVTTTGPLEATLAIDYAGLLRSDAVQAFLPAAVNDALKALEFRDGAPGRIIDGLLHLRRSGAPEQDDHWQTEFTGRIEAKQATFLAGLTFTEVDGTLDLDAAHESGRPLRFSAVGRASHAVVLGQTLHDVEAPITLNEAGDALLIPAAHARCGEGAVAATATSGVGERRDFAVRVDVVGVPLANMVRPSTPPAPSPANGDLDPVVVPAPPSSAKPVSGLVYASVTLSGERGDAPGKRGRGVIRVLNGHLSAIPLVLQALQVMQLTLPLTGDLDFADADMFIVGDTAHFEHILFESSVGQAAALQLLGEGTLDLNTMQVAARFRPRSGIAVLRDIMGGIGDMFYEIELTGPLRDPKARIVPLP